MEVEPSTEVIEEGRISKVRKYSGTRMLDQGSGEYNFGSFWAQIVKQMVLKLKTCQNGLFESTQ